MKKLIYLIILGIIFFIGGQWLGLHFSGINQAQRKDGSALVVDQVIDDAAVLQLGTQKTSGGSGPNL